MLSAKSKGGLRLIVIAFVTLAVASSSIVSSVQSAAATSMVNLWAVPVNSRIDDGHLQILRLLCLTDEHGAVEKIRITIDGTKVLEFDANGNIIGIPDPAYASVDGFTRLKIVFGDGYYNLFRLLQCKYKVGVDKTELSIGKHTAVAEIFFVGGGVLTDDAMFNLRAGKSGMPDLVAEVYAAQNNIQQSKKSHTFFIESNGGTAKAMPHHVRAYLSSDASLDTSVDQLVGEKHTGALPVGHLRLVQIQIHVPCGSATGEMFLIAWTDSGEVVDESNEGNNIAMDEVNVIGCSVDEDAEVEAADLEDDDGDDDKKGKGHSEKAKKDKNKGKHDD